MKKLLLMFLVSTIIYLVFTAIISILIGPMVYVDETLKWQAQLWMFGNMCLTILITWLIFSRSYPHILPSVVITVIVVNLFKIISQAIDGYFSIAHISLLSISVVMLITLYEKVNKEVKE